MDYYIPLKYSEQLTSLKNKNLDALAEKAPRSDVWMLGQQLNATFKTPSSDSVLSLDRLRSYLIGVPEFWQFARTLSSQLGKDDCIFCEGEDLGIPLANIFGSKPNRPKIAVHIHNSDRPRAKLAMKLFKSAHLIDLFMVHSRAQSDFLENYLNLPKSKLCLFQYPVDCNFFKPGLASGNKVRPIIASVGLEMRDYRLLAQATENLDLDVKIAGFSQFRSGLPQNFPKTMPANMSNQFYDPLELLQLYRDADLVAVCLQPSNWSAGVTALLEAMACGRPIVVTRTEGMAEYIQDPDALKVVEPGDAEGLQQAIIHLLNHPHEAEAMGQKAHQIANQRYSIDRQMEVVANLLKNKLN